MNKYGYLKINILLEKFNSEGEEEKNTGKKAGRDDAHGMCLINALL